MPKTEQEITEGVKWIDETNPSKEEVAELSRTYNLNHHIVQDCMEPEHLPKFETVEDVQFMIVRYLAHKDDSIPTTIQELTNKIAIFYTDGFLITIHKADIPFIEEIRKRFQPRSKSYSTTEVLLKIVWNALETFDGRATILSAKVDVCETAIMDRQTDNNQMEVLYHLKRQASLSQKVLMLMQEPINHFFPKPGEEPAVQDVKDQLLKMRTLYGQILEDVNNLMNLLLSFSAQRTNDVVKVLTIFSVFFMPLTFLVGIYGMNFEFMPELKEKWGYPGLLILMVIVTICIYIWFKRKKWL